LKPLGVDFNYEDYDGRRLMHIACKEGRLEAVKFLLKEEVEVNPVDKNGKSPLWEAVIGKNKEIIEVVRGHNGVVKAHKEDIVDKLLEYGANNDFEGLKLMILGGVEKLEEYGNFDDRNIGHIAMRCKCKEILTVLTEIGFDFNKKDRWGKTPKDEI
jgi:lysophospholipase